MLLLLLLGLVKDTGTTRAATTQDTLLLLYRQYNRATEVTGTRGDKALAAIEDTTADVVEYTLAKESCLLEYKFRYRLKSDALRTKV